MIENLLLMTHVVVAILLVIIVLLQRSDGGMGSLGGDGASAIFSSQSGGNTLTKMTSILAVIFMATSMLLAMEVSGNSRPESVVDEIQVDANAPVIPTVPVQLEGEATPNE